jgi:transcriptional regulator with XRE-family HTH domain
MSRVRQRVAEALRARVSPRGGVAVKKLAQGIGRSSEAIRQWLNGEAAIKAEDLAAVARYLKDPALISEVFRDLDPPPARERFLWFTDGGLAHDAPAGHSDFVRRYVGLPLHVAGDCSVYAMRSLGWVELTTCGTGARIRYHAKGLNRAAAQATRDWLLGRADQIISVSRAVFIGIEWAHAPALTVVNVAAELDLAASSIGTPRRRVARKSLDLLTPRLGKILSAWQNERDDAIRAAQAVGLTGRLSVFAADDAGNVICHRIGPTVRMPHHECEGANLLAWSDPAYSAELRRAILEAREDGPTYTEVESPIFGPPAHYDRLTLPMADSIITITELRRR